MLNYQQNQFGFAQMDFVARFATRKKGFSWSAGKKKKKKRKERMQIPLYPTSQMQTKCIAIFCSLDREFLSPTDTGRQMTDRAENAQTKTSATCE